MPDNKTRVSKVIWNAEDDSHSIEELEGERYLVIRQKILVPKISISLSDAKSKLALFTKRQRQVYAGIIDGKRNKEIAYELNLSERTIKFHVSELFHRTGLKSRFELATMLEKVQ